MQHQISVPVEGNLFLDPHGDQALTASRNEVQFALVPDDDNRIVRASATCSVPTGSNPTTNDRLVETLKALHAHLSFSLGQGAIFTMDFHNMEHTPIADGHDEIGNVASYRIQQKYIPEVGQLDGDDFRRLVQNMPRYESLTAAKELFRRGLIFYRNHAYFCAFVHFIFIVECFYAGGKTGKRQVIEEFKKSTEFGRIVESVLAQMPTTATVRELRVLMQEAGYDWTTDGITHFLYEARGRLLHHFEGPNRFNPFSEDEHRPVAFLAMDVGYRSILHRTLRINQTTPSQPENQVKAPPSPPSAAPRHHPEPPRRGIGYHRVLLSDKVPPGRVAELIKDVMPSLKNGANCGYGYVGSVLDYPEGDDNVALAIIPTFKGDGARPPAMELFCRVGNHCYIRSMSTLDHAKVSFPNDGHLFILKAGSNEIVVSSELLSERVVIDLLRFGCNFAK